MKKLFTLVCGLLLACGASAQTAEELAFKIDTYPWNYTAEVGSDIQLNFDSQWSEYGIIGSSNAINPADYKGYKILYDADPTAEAGNWIQTSIGQAAGKQQYNDLDPAATELVQDFNEDIKSYESLAKLNIQAKGANVHFHLKGVALITNDGVQIPLVSYAGGGWGWSLGPVATPYINFTGQWGALEIVSQDGESLTFSHETDADKEYQYTLELSEALENTAMVELDNAKGGFAYFNMNVGDTELSFKVNKETAQEEIKDEDGNGTGEYKPSDVVKIYLKANGDKETSIYPFTLDVKSISRIETTYTPTGISNTVVAPVAKSSKIYNLAGQQVDTSYKGVVVKDGKKYVQK